MAENKPLVLVAHPLPDGWISTLENAPLEILTGSADTAGLSSELIAALPKASALLTWLIDPIKKSILQNAPNLKVISNMAVGVNNIDLEACTRFQIPVGHTPGVLTESCADQTMALLLSAARRLPETSADAKAGRWGLWAPDQWLGKELNQATLGIIGMGKIGMAVAKRAKAFGLNILYHSRTNKPKAERLYQAKQVSLNDLLKESDFVSLHTPLTKETEQLIDDTALAQMKPDSILINMARGAVVDTDALHHALSTGIIGGAALDVTDPEPLPPEHPLFSLKNCLITPHIGSATLHTRKAMTSLACDNILAALSDKRLIHCANPEVYNK